MSDNKIPYEELIIRYLDGDATIEETQRLETWMAAAPENKLEFEQMQALFMLSSDLDIADEIDVESDLEQVKAKLNPKHTARATSLTRRILKIAASVILLAVASYVFYIYSPESSAHMIALSDGTKVYLRDDATLDYPETFDENERRVALHGEAYFDVSHDPSKPFIVDAADTEIRVLGTTFLINEKTDQVDVIVNSGKVRFSPKQNLTRHLILTANEHGTFEDDQLKEQANSNANYLSWHTGNFEFTQTKITDILKELSSYYPNMKLGNASAADCQLDLHFKKEKLKTVIKMIESSCQVKATKSNGVIVFI